MIVMCTYYLPTKNALYVACFEQAPDYFKIVKEPMDFTAMRKKIDGFVYKNMEELEKDFDLMIDNCMKYNGKDTVFYRAATRLRDQVISQLQFYQIKNQIIGPFIFCKYLFTDLQIYKIDIYKEDL